MHGSAALGITFILLQVLPHEDMTADIVKRYPRFYLPTNLWVAVAVQPSLTSLNREADLYSRHGWSFQSDTQAE